MFNKLNLVYRLFRVSFFIMTILYILTIVIILSIIALKTAYKNSLQEEFATKQPHIIVRYINEEEYKPKDIEMIKNLSSKIETIAPFIKGEKFFISTASKIGAISQYNGDITIIGMEYKNLVYDFFNIKYGVEKNFNIPYTPLEVIYFLKTNNNSVILNESLFNQYYPILESVSSVFIDKYKAKFLGVFNDFEKKAILYTTIPFAKKLLNKKNINGFFINVKDLNEIDSLKKVLQNSLKDKFVVISWLDNKRKQFMMFFLYETLSKIIIGAILLLSLLFISLLLYNSIIKKSYQLSVLFTLGFYLKKEIFLFLFLSIIINNIVLSIFILEILPIIVQYMDQYIKLSFSIDIIKASFCYMAGISLFFLLLSYVLIDSSYKIKAKSVF